MASPILLRNRLFAGQLDAEAISAYMELSESGLHGVAAAIRSGQGKVLIDRLMWHLSERPEVVVAAMVRRPEYPAVLFACLPAPEMFNVFAAVEMMDATLLPLSVEHAPGALRAVARERFSFVGAMSKLCSLLACCKIAPTAQAPQPSM